MSKKWSSFNEQQILTENWRKFLTEEEVQAEEIEEGFLGRIGTAAKAGAKAAKKSWDETRPKQMVDYPATEMTTIVNLISNVANKNGLQVNISAIIDELEAMLKAQNFVIKEQGELMLGQELNLVLDQVPALRAFLTALNQKNPEDFKKVEQAFKSGGFKIAAAAPVAAQPAQTQQPAAQPVAQPAAEPEQPIIEPRSAMDRAIGLSGYPAPGEPEEIPTAGKTEREPEAQPFQQQRNFNNDTGVPISEEGRDMVIDKIKNAKNQDDFKKAYNLLNKSQYGGKDPLDSILQKVDSFDENTSTHDIVGAIMQISSFGKKDGSIITRGKFEELFLTPEQRKAYRDNIKASNEIKNILKKDFESEAFKTDFPEFADYDFDQQYAAFISDLRALVSKINELRRDKMASGLGVDVKDINALAKKYPPIFKVIARFRPSAEEQQMFLSDLLNVVRGTPKKAEKDLSPEETPTVIKTPEEPEKEEFLKFPDDFPTSLKDIYDLAKLSAEKKEDRDQIVKISSDFKAGQQGIIMDLLRDEQMGASMQFRKTGNFEKGATKEPLEHWQKLYKKITNEKIIKSKDVEFRVKAYLVGLMNQMENRGAIEEDQETLNESTMLRWKELAGIL